MKSKHILIIILLIFTSIPLNAQENSEQAHLIYGVPYEAQPSGSAYCGPACLSMMLKYWGKNTEVTQDEIVKEVYNSFFNGTFASSIENYLSSRGYTVINPQRPGTIDEIKEYIQKDIPVMVIQSMSEIDNLGHFRVVIGFDDKKQEIICQDPALGRIYTMSYKVFLGAWKYYKQWMMVFYPSNYKEILSQKDPSAPYEERTPDMNAKVHLVYGRAYFKEGSYQDALKEIQEGLNMAADKTVRWNLRFLQSESYIEMGNTQEAEKAIYAEGIEEMANNPYAYYILARINYQEGKYEGGTEYAQKAIERYPYFAKAYLILGKCQKKLGQRGMARISFEKALKLDINLLEAMEERDSEE